MKLHIDHVGAGPDLVLLHGWGLHSGVWSEVVDPLAMSMRVHSVDLPGHGHSLEAGVDHLDAAADAVAAAIPEGSVVCGWSLGGLVAQRMARRHPKHVRMLALVSTTPRFLQGDDWHPGAAPATLETFARGLRDDPAATIETFVTLNALHGARGREAVRALLAGIAQRPGPSLAALERGLDWLRETDLRTDAAWIAVPTLVLHGARDMLVPVGAGRWLAQSMPQATLVEWPDAAHLPFFTHREAFVAALESFVG